MTQQASNISEQRRDIPLSEHAITSDLIHYDAISVVEKLQQAGYEAYLVGGCVRDLLLGVTPKDFDVATSAKPEEVRRLFSNCRLIGRRFRLAHILFGRHLIEVATFRGSADELNDDHVTADGRILRDNIYGTLEEDAVRRDFTINALYYDVKLQNVIEFGTGLEDIKAKQIKIIGDPDVRFREDPVRMLRASRFAAKLGFDIESNTKQAMQALAYLLDDISPARIFDETKKLFLSGFALKTYQQLQIDQLFRYLFPQTARLLQEGHGSQSDRHLIELAMRNTDTRIAQEKPVTPAFLYAVLLWPQVRDLADQLLSEKALSKRDAIMQAGSQMASLQAQKTSIPKRFSLPMKEIWAMQPWFEQRKKHRVVRLLAHPRFRAAYDFLLLRADVGQAEKDLAQWWTDVQENDEYKALVQKNINRTKSAQKNPRKRRHRSNS